MLENYFSSVNSFQLFSKSHPRQLLPEYDCDKRLSSGKCVDECSTLKRFSHCRVSDLLGQFGELSGFLHKIHQSGEHGDVSWLKTHLLDLRDDSIEL